MSHAAFVSFGFFAYPKEYIVENSKRAFDLAVKAGLDAKYFGPVLEYEDAEKVVKQLSSHAYDFVVAHVTTWTMTPIAMRVLRECGHKPLLVWGLGGKTVKGTLVSPASPAGTSALLWSLRQMGIKYSYVYDHPDGKPKVDEVMRFAKVVDAIRAINGAKLGVMGYCDMGLYALMIDGVALKRQLGLDIEDIFSYEAGKLADEAPKAEVAKVIAEMRKDLAFETEPTDAQLEKTARLTYALRKKVKERGYLGVTMKCVYGVSRYMGFTPCLTQALLAKDVVSICESDAAGLVTELVLKMVCGQNSTFMEHYEYFPDKALVGVCGFAPFDMTQGRKVPCKCAGWGGFTGLYETAKMKTGTVTIGRMYSEEGRLKMLLLTAEAELPMKWAELGWADPTPDFPSLLITPRCGMQRYIDAVPAQHVNIVYGDQTAQVKEFCKFTGVEVVE